MDYKKLSDELKAQSFEQDAYFGFVQYVQQEFCIQANSEGLKLFAAKLLELVDSKDESRSSMVHDEWIEDQMDLKYIEVIDKSQSEVDQVQISRAPSNWYLLRHTLLLLVIVYLLFSSIYFNFMFLIS